MQKKSGPSDEGTQIKLLGAQTRSIVAEYLDEIHFAGDCIPFLDRIECLGAIIAFWGARMNLTAEPDNPRELAFHIIDSLSPVIFADSEGLLKHAFRAGNQVLDLGSGVGFPGLVLASASSATFTLIESRRKRSSFLAVAAAQMNLSNVVVESRRLMAKRAGSNASWKGTEANPSDSFDVVTARGYALPSAFYPAAASTLRPGGIAILFGNSGQDLALPDAEKNGLYEFRSIAYMIPRGSRMVERILGLWQRR